jgi:hypothetical protein
MVYIGIMSHNFDRKNFRETNGITLVSEEIKVHNNKIIIAIEILCRNIVKSKLCFLTNSMKRIINKTNNKGSVINEISIGRLGIKCPRLTDNGVRKTIRYKILS